MDKWQVVLATWITSNIEVNGKVVARNLDHDTADRIVETANKLVEELAALREYASLLRDGMK